MKQAQIAIILSVKQNTYSNWENGTRNPSLEMLVKIADYYKTSTDYLLGRYKEKE
nr:MAG TPA: helix-turn-helix domain protein [Inoviridae sp.]